MNRRFVIVFSVGWSLLCIGAGFYFVRFKKLQLLPIDKEVYHAETYHEGLDSMYSKADLNFENETAVLNYTLSPTYIEPFAAFCIRKTDLSFIDLSEFNTVAIDIESDKGSRFPVILTVDYEGFSNHTSRFPRIHYSTFLKYDKPGVYNLSLSDFEISSWWLRHHNKRKEDFNTLDLRRVKYFIIESCKLLGNNDSDEIRISSVVFYIDNTLTIIYIGLAWILGLFGFGLVYLFKKKIKIIVPIRGLEIQSKESKIDRLVAYISENYANPKLSVEQMENEIGLAKREAGQLLKQTYNTSFKSYLNTIRLTEVKNLLKETDLSVSEIAYMVGYNSVPHFNRIFKEQVGMSPLEFKERLRSN